MTSGFRSLFYVVGVMKSVTSSAGRVRMVPTGSVVFVIVIIIFLIPVVCSFTTDDGLLK